MNCGAVTFYTTFFYFIPFLRLTYFICLAHEHCDRDGHGQRVYYPFNRFRLSEKEARTYLYLLKYGPKTPSPLTKSLKTYREDVHRTLTSLIDKEMVRPSLDSLTIYAAIDLDTTLESAVKKRESELREMEVRKRELKELA